MKNRKTYIELALMSFLIVLQFSSVYAQTWKVAENLQAGDKVLMANNHVMEINKIRIVEMSLGVYNFEVEGLHNYYISDAGILVHNLNSTDCDQLEKKMIEDKKAYDEALAEYDKLNDLMDYLQSGSPGQKRKALRKIAKRHDLDIIDPKTALELLEGDVKLKREVYWQKGIEYYGSAFKYHSALRDIERGGDK